MIFDTPDMSLDDIRSYSAKMIADLQSDPPMIDVHERERQAHAVIHHLLTVIDDMGKEFGALMSVNTDASTRKATTSITTTT